jgi:hypothetical protein
MDDGTDVAANDVQKRSWNTDKLHACEDFGNIK